MQPRLEQTNTTYSIKLIIDPWTESEYDSGATLQVGGALTFDRVVNPIVYPTDKSIILEGLNHGQYLTINSTRCLVNGENYSITSLGMTRIACNIPINQLSIGVNDV